MAKPERVLKPLTLKLSEIKDPVCRKQVEDLFKVFSQRRADAMIASREAAIADAKATTVAAQAAIKQQEMRMAFMETIHEAAKHLEQINTEQTWTMFRDKDGELNIECPFTEADQRSAMRAQRANVVAHTKALNSDVEGLYDEAEEERHVGFGASSARTRKPAVTAESDTE